MLKLLTQYNRPKYIADRDKLILKLMRNNTQE